MKTLYWKDEMDIATGWEGDVDMGLSVWYGGRDKRNGWGWDKCLSVGRIEGADMPG